MSSLQITMVGETVPDGLAFTPQTLDWRAYLFSKEVKEMLKQVQHDKYRGTFRISCISDYC
jgi:hypothetical protein